MSKTAKKKSRQPWVNFAPLAFGLLAIPAQAMAVDPPTAPCDTSQVIAYRSAASGTTNNLPAAVFHTELLYSTSLLTAVDTAAGSLIDQSLMDRFEGMWVIQDITTGGILNQAEMDTIANEGFSDIEYVCPIAGLSDSATPKLKASAKLSTNTIPWHEIETGTHYAKTWVDTQISAPFYGVSPRVAVLDTGIDSSLVPTLSSGWSMNGSSWLTDSSGHGTAVAHLIYSASDGYADILSMKVLDSNGRGSHISLTRGLLHAIAAGADIINLSLGHPSNPLIPEGRMPNYLVEALGAARQSEARVIAAAGNLCASGIACDDFYPATAPQTASGLLLDITSVSGLKSDGERTEFTLSKDADLYAPSNHLCVTSPTSVSASGSRRLSGSSFSTAQVSGALALLMAYQSHLNAGPVSNVQRTSLLSALINSGGSPSTPFCGTGKRLNMCTTLNFLTGYGHPACNAYSQLASPASDTCSYNTSTLADVSQTFMTSGDDYQIDGGVAPNYVDLGNKSAWCNGYSSAPSRELCSYCDLDMEDIDGGARSGANRPVTISSLGSTGYDQFTLTVDLPLYWALYDNYQVKLVQSGSETYIALDLHSMGLSNGAVTLTYTGSFDSEYVGDPDEAFLIAQDTLLSNPPWTASPLNLSFTGYSGAKTQ